MTEANFRLRCDHCGYEVPLADLPYPQLDQPQLSVMQAHIAAEHGHSDAG